MKLTQSSIINSPQFIRGGVGAWSGPMSEALRYDPDRVIMIEDRLVERDVITRSEDEDGNILIEGELDWWAGDHLDLWTLEDVRDFLDDPNATVKG